MTSFRRTPHTNSGTLEFNPPSCATGCGGPRTTPVNYDRAAGAGSADTTSDLRAELERLKQALSALAVRKED